MRYAIIENGVVTNIVLADAPLEENWVEATGPAQIGGSWDGAVFSAPPPDIAAERATMQCSPLQGQLALGEAQWTAVEALAADPTTPWALRRTILSAQIWRRTDADMDALIWAMGLTADEADDLFRLAATL